MNLAGKLYYQGSLLVHVEKDNGGFLKVRSYDLQPPEWKVSDFRSIEAETFLHIVKNYIEVDEDSARGILMGIFER